MQVGMQFILTNGFKRLTKKENIPASILAWQVIKLAANDILSCQHYTHDYHHYEHKFLSFSPSVYIYIYIYIQLHRDAKAHPVSVGWVRLRYVIHLIPGRGPPPDTPAPFSEKTSVGIIARRLRRPSRGILRNQAYFVMAMLEFRFGCSFPL